MKKLKKLTKSEAEQEIDNFFKNLQDKTPEDIKKIKRLSMKYNIKLGNKRKLFCKKCYFPLKNAKIRIRKNKKIVQCKNCSHIAR